MASRCVWRGETLHPWSNQLLAVAERSVVVGYEAVIGAAVITL